MKFIRYLPVFGISVLCLCSALAHGDLHERILEVSDQIEATPDSAYLYFYRGKLRCQHEQFDLSLEDMRVAKGLGYQEIQLQHFCALANFQLQKYRPALRLIESLLDADPHNVTALKLKAKILHAQGDFSAAAETHHLVIDHAIRTFPENYLDAAQALLDNGGNEAVLLALEALDQGITDLGPVLTLVQKKKEIYLNEGDFPEALKEQTKIIETSERKEVSFFRAAEIALLLDDSELAREYLVKSRKAIFALPNNIRNTGAMHLLDQQTRIFLTQLNTPPNEVH